MQPKIYSFDQHQISLNQIDKDALYVMEKLSLAGYTAYLVGGGVRDLLLKQKPKDFDISTSAKPEEIKKLFRNCLLIGRRFRLAHIRFGRKILEVSTFRAGDNETEELIIRDNEWGSIEEDVKRRDFTINGMFYDPATETVIDYAEGYPDIERKLVRTIGIPFARFKQDPVRMIRLLKFQARFGLEVDKSTYEALLECRAEILKSAPARILEEFFKMLESGHSALFFKLMTEHGLLQLMTPVLAEFLEKVDGGEVYSYLEEIDRMCKESPEKSIERSVLLSCIVYPLFTRSIQTHYVDRNRMPHLGEIQNEAYNVVGETFHPFFHIPRRIAMSMVSILTTQYRLTPLEKRRPGRLRVPGTPEFGLALQFLQIRSCIEHGLQKVCEDWNEVYKKDETPEAPEEKPRRRRRPRKRAAE